MPVHLLSQSDSIKPLAKVCARIFKNALQLRLRPSDRRVHGLRVGVLINGFRCGSWLPQRLAPAAVKLFEAPEFPADEQQHEPVEEQKRRRQIRQQLRENDDQHAQEDEVQPVVASRSASFIASRSLS